MIELPAADNSWRALSGQLLKLAIPVWIEQSLHIAVGINDTYLANKLNPVQYANDAAAAIGTITYFLWFIGLLVGSVGTGTTAIISRARGARHQRLANSVTGQSVTAAVLIGLVVGALLYLFARPIITMTQLGGGAPLLAMSYLRLLSLSLPFSMLMFIAGSCQRGGGDTVSAAVVMVIVDIINMVCSFALCRGWFGLPVMGFNGIAIGTIIAYVSGGVIQLIVLMRGRAVRLYWHRLRPHLETIRRLFRIGAPALVEGVIQWLANFGVIAIVNHADTTNAMSAAHMNTIRIESVSFLSGMAFATAAATMVGMSLGRGDPLRARRSAYVAYFFGGGVMTFCGLLMILFGNSAARLISAPDQHIISMTRICLAITGCIQCSFAASLIFGGALRGAGDTFIVMLINLSTILFLRFTGVCIVGLWLHLGLIGIWCVLAGELFTRGLLMFLRFRFGAWSSLQV